MANATHVIELYEPGNFTGHNPMHIKGVGVIRGRDRVEYFLANLVEPFDCDGDHVEQIVLQPRYYGDKIQRAEKDLCTISILRVRPDVSLNVDSTLDFSSIIKWGCGKITPIRNK